MTYKKNKLQKIWKICVELKNKKSENYQNLCRFKKWKIVKNLKVKKRWKFDVKIWKNLFPSFQSSPSEYPLKKNKEKNQLSPGLYCAYMHYLQKQHHHVLVTHQNKHHSSLHVNKKTEYDKNPIPCNFLAWKTTNKIQYIQGSSVR